MNLHKRAKKPESLRTQRVISKKRLVEQSKEEEVHTTKNGSSAGGGHSKSAWISSRSPSRAPELVPPPRQQPNLTSTSSSCLVSTSSQQTHNLASTTAACDHLDNVTAQSRILIASRRLMRWLLLALFVVHVSADLPSCSGARCFHCEVQFIARMCPTVCGECTKTSFTNLVNTKKDAGSAPVVTKSTVQTVVHPATVSQDAQAVAAAKAAAAPTQNVQTPVPQAQVAVAQPRAVAQPQAQLPVQQRAPQPAVQQYQQPQQQQYNQQPQQPQQQFYQQNAQQPGQQFARPAQPVQQQFQQPAQQQYQQPGQQQYQQPGQYQQPAQQQYQQPGQQQYQQPGQQQFQQPAQPQYQQPAQAQYQTQGQQQYQQPAQKPQYQQQGVAQQFQQQPARPQQPYAATPAPQVSTSTLAPIAELPRPDTNLAGRPADLAQPLPEYTRNPALPFYNPPMLPQVNPLYPQQNSQQQSAFFNPFQPFLQHTAQAGGQTNPMDPFGLFGGANAFGQHNMFGTQQAATPAAANNGQAATQNYNQYYNQGQYTYGNEAKTTGNQQNYQQYQQGQYQQGQTQPTAVQPTQQAQYTTNSNTQSSQATVVSPQQQASSNSISNSYVKALSTASEKTCPRQPGWLPCISKEEANTRFSQCCVRLGDGCAPLCNYDANLATMQLAVLTGRCALSKVADVMICASGYVDVTECCQAYNVFEPGFEHCRPYCNPAAGLPSGGLLSEKYKCLAKLSAIQQCFYVSQKPA